MQKQDFFFGQLSANKDKVTCIDWYRLLERAEAVSPSFLVKQLNRLLRSVGGEVVVHNETSYPSFHSLLKKIPMDEIGLVEIESRTDRNNNVNATLACSLYLTEGVVHIRPHWCAYKPIRADEIISTLLAPLHLYGHIEKTFLNITEGETPEVISQDLRAQIYEILELADYPYHSAADEDGKWMNRNITTLAEAQEVAAKNLPQSEREKAYHR